MLLRASSGDVTVAGETQYAHLAVSRQMHHGERRSGVSVRVLCEVAGGTLGPLDHIYIRS